MRSIIPGIRARRRSVHRSLHISFYSNWKLQCRFQLFVFNANGYFDGEHGTSSCLTGKQKVVPYEFAAMSLLHLSYEENIFSSLAFRIIQFLDMTTFWKGISEAWQVANVQPCLGVGGSTQMHRRSVMQGSGDQFVTWMILIALPFHMCLGKGLMLAWKGAGRTWGIFSMLVVVEQTYMSKLLQCQLQQSTSWWC